MAHDITYAIEKYTTAVHTLATGNSPLRDRLADAYMNSAMHALHPDDTTGNIPDELVERSGRCSPCRRTRWA